MKKVLITAGATWMKLDGVRIITNVFTGRTGLFLAKEFVKCGVGVTLLINPSRLQIPLNGRRLKTVPFFYYNELENELKRNLAENSYDMIVHTAAVSDYKVKDKYSEKIPSGIDKITIELLPVKKLTNVIRRYAKSSVLVQFKLEMKRQGLSDKAYKSLLCNKGDYVVANALEDIKIKYKADLIDKNKNITAIKSRKDLARKLIAIIT